ncbi:hypothetical protein TGAM01_v207365 [Trichoderma gamsii]|uniref:Uncharacterized protein n=1 Tax=Trichoderma gamsii TaxID=398673 RepID=A0A0W7VHT2_9HYPO|nr:hypothetical protein TGAM01_v207365 [Trichoderma gamsii]PNP39933.1 hypothetical protein TGAMA5MH_08199 [Trichoderma gamsii]PON23718.1 hypothetical protein TGAM01_v207365 [Trichoderma gamsii]
MKTSAVIVAAYAAAAAALPSFGSFHWVNSTGVNSVNSTSVPSNVTTITNSTAIANSTSGAGASSGVSGVSAIGGDSATAPYFTNDTSASNVTYLGGGNETHFSPNRTHLPVPVRRFRAQRKSLV